MKKTETFPDPHDAVDKLLKDKGNGLLGKSEQLQKTYDNLVFRKRVRDNPVMTKHGYRVFGAETVDLNSFLALRLWPRSIYVTDKLLRLVAGSKLEVLKRYIAKKRSVPLNMIWILFIIIGVIVAIVVILILLPKFTGGG
jgi:hypothetical protein